MLDRLADLLPWSGRVRRFDVDAAPADVLLQSSLVLRGLGASLARLDLDAGTLEARLAVGGVLRVHAEADADMRSHVAIGALVADEREAHLLDVESAPDAGETRPSPRACGFSSRRCC